MNTLLLDTQGWDLVLDASGNIALASDPYSIAQDVASALRLFDGELWYDTSKGVPYWQEILGKFPPLATIKTDFVNAAMTVPGVATAQAFITSINNRELSGQVQTTTTTGVLSVTPFGTKQPLRDSAGNIVTDSWGRPVYAS